MLYSCDIHATTFSKMTMLENLQSYIEPLLADNIIMSFCVWLQLALSTATSFYLDKKYYHLRWLIKNANDVDQLRPYGREKVMANYTYEFDLAPVFAHGV